jgi:hypothetical protein
MYDKTFEEVLDRLHTITFSEQLDMIVAIAPAAILNQRLGIIHCPKLS